MVDIVEHIGRNIVEQKAEYNVWSKHRRTKVEYNVWSKHSRTQSVGRNIGRNKKAEYNVWSKHRRTKSRVQCVVET